MSEKKDLTRIQDLSEFTHEDDQEAEKLLRVNFEEEDDDDQVEESDFLSPSELDDEESPSYQMEEPEEGSFEMSEESFSMEEPDSANAFEMEAPELPDVPNEFTNEEESFNSDEELNNYENIDETNESGGAFEDNHFEVNSDLNEEAEEYSNEYDDTQNDDYSQSDDFENSEGEEIQENADDLAGPQESEILETFIPGTGEQKAQQRVDQDLEKAEKKPTEKESTSFAKELKKFSEGYSYNMVQSPGSPPYTLIGHRIMKKHHEDVLRYIREYKIAGDIEIYKQSLQDNQILISHIGEYVAILMANKLTRLGATVQIAPSDVIHTSVHYEAQDNYGSSKDSLDYEEEEDVDLTDHITATNVLLSTTPFLQGYKIHKYLGVVQDFVILKTSELKEIINQKEASDHEINDILDQEFFNSKLIIHEFHDTLRDSLEFQAKKKKGNAIVGLQYSYLRPDRNTFEITCIGTAVFAVKLKDSDLI